MAKKTEELKDKKIKKEIIIEVIPNKYRIDITDGRNYITQEYKTVNTKEEGSQKKWVETEAPYHSSFTSAFKRIRDLLIVSKIKSKGKITVDEFLQLYKQNDEELFKLFKSKFKGD